VQLDPESLAVRDRYLLMIATILPSFRTTTSSIWPPLPQVSTSATISTPPGGVRACAIDARAISVANPLRLCPA